MVQLPSKTRLVDRIGSWRAAVLRRLLERPFTGFLIRSADRFREIEGRHLAFVIGANLFIAVIPLLIVSYALVQGFNPHRTVGTVIVDNFRLTGNTAKVVRETFPNAKSGESVALSISVISLLITGLDISKTVQLAYARAFGMSPLGGLSKYVRGASWLMLLLVTTGIALALRYVMATQSLPWLLLAIPGWLAIQYGFFLVSPQLLLELPFRWRDLAPVAAVCTAAVIAVTALLSFELHRWFEQYAKAYGGFGVGLALMAGVAILASFWVWIAALMGTYWERRVGSDTISRMEELSADLAHSSGAAGGPAASKPAGEVRSSRRSELARERDDAVANQGGGEKHDDRRGESPGVTL